MRTVSAALNSDKRFAQYESERIQLEESLPFFLLSRPFLGGGGPWLTLRIHGHRPQTTLEWMFAGINLLHVTPMSSLGAALGTAVKPSLLAK